MSITKAQVISNLEEIKKYVSEIETEKKETKKINIQIKNHFTGSIIFESEKTTYKEAVVEAKTNGVSMRDADLRGADLSGADLSGAYLRSANLRDADLRDADLRGAYLRSANLRGADLRDADLSGADLSGADLRDAYLRDAELNYAKFYGRRLDL
jgi:uncharacterized protein YjbI with pentapeptide repeats